MPDLGQVYVQIVPSAKGIEGSITKIISGESSDAGVAAGKNLLSGLKNTLLTAGALASVGKLFKDTLSNYANYEQLVGGVETLFKDSANVVQRYAENAYKTAGLSANDYMETVTSFSASLLQSLGGDTEKAAKQADVAITDMSDNANKMGSSMESIQNAYQGFAKSNYTMLDNLKLGYGGTKTEMERLLKDAEAISGIHYDISSYSDVVDAIHVIQTEMGIAGTTAKEASETISGSIGSLKGAWNNLLTGLANGDADIEKLINNVVDSAETALENIIPAARQVLSGLGTLIKDLAPVITEFIPVLTEDVIPAVLEGAGEIIGALIANLPSLLISLQNALPSMLIGILGGVAGAVDEVTMSFQDNGEAMMSETDQALLLAKQLGVLTDRSQKSAETQETIKGVVAELNQLMPDLGLSYDDVTDSVNLTTDAVMDLIHTQINQEKIADLMVELQQVEEDRADTAAKLADAEMELAYAQANSSAAGEALRNSTSNNVTANLELNDAVTDTSDELEKAQILVEALSDENDYLTSRSDELTRQIAELGGTTADTTNEEEHLANASGNVADGLDEEATAAKAAKGAIVGIAREALNARATGGDLREEYNRLSGELDKLRDTGEKTDIQLAEQQLHMLDLAATNQELSESFNTMGIKATGSLTQLSQFLIDAGVSADDYASSVASMRDSVVNSYKTLRDENAITAQEMVDTLTENYNIQQNWTNNLAQLWRDAEDDTIRAYIYHLYELGPQYAYAVSQFADGGTDMLRDAAYEWADISGLSAENAAWAIYAQRYLAGDAAGAVGDAITDGFDVSTESWNTGTTAAGKYIGAVSSANGANAGSAVAGSVVSGFQSQMGNFSNIGSSMVSGIVDGISNSGTAVKNAVYRVLNDAYNYVKQGTQTGFSYIGYDVDSGIIKGISDSSYAVKSAIYKVLNDAYNYVKQGTETGFSYIGYYVDSGIISGMSNSGYAVNNAAAAVLTNAYNYVKSGTESGWYWIGYYIDAGIISGMWDYSSYVSNAAVGVAKAAYKAAKKALGINSPSKLFRDKIGASIPEGMALGIEQNAYLVTRAMQGLAESTVGAYRLNGVSAYGIGSSLAPGYGSAYNNTINVTVNGAESPEDYANRLARQLQLQMRMA